MTLQRGGHLSRPGLQTLRPPILFQHSLQAVNHFRPLTHEGGWWLRVSEQRSQGSNHFLSSAAELASWVKYSMFKAISPISFHFVNHDYRGWRVDQGSSQFAPNHMHPHPHSQPHKPPSHSHMLSHIQCWSQTITHRLRDTCSQGNSEHAISESHNLSNSQSQRLTISETKSQRVTRRHTQPQELSFTTPTT